MKLIIGIAIGISILAFVGTCSVYGTAVTNSVKDKIADSTPAEFDVQVARAKVIELKNELIEDNRNLARLRRDIERGDHELNETKSQIDGLAAQIEAGARMLNSNNSEFIINNNKFTRDQIEIQVESYLNQRANLRETLRRREENAIRLGSKLVEMESKIAQKRLAAQDYESQIAMLEIDVRFQSMTDRYDVNTGNTEIQSVIDRLADKVHVNGVDETTGTIDFVNTRSDINDRINEELNQ